jgi:cobalt-zinc-cadmium efflux system outer membrane protein
MPTRAQVCTWIAAVGLLAPAVAAGQDRTEREIVELIVREGPQASAIRAEAEVTRREQLARVAYPNPSVTYSREGAGFTEFFQAEQSLPIFGIRGALSRAGAEATAAAEADRDVRLWSLRSDAASAVARIVAGQERLEGARAQVREVERLIEILRTREREGEGSKFDRLRAEQELRDTNQIVASAAVALAEARSTVAGMLPSNVSLSTVTRSEVDSREPVPVETLMTKAISTRAELRALQRRGQRTSFEAEAARKSRFPGPSLFGGVKRADAVAGRETGGVFGLSIALPLFDSGDHDAARWEAERARVEAERTSIEHRIRSEVNAASEVFALRLGALRQEQPGAADELVQIAVVAYREGEVGILELLDAVRTAARARNRDLDLRLDARLAQITLERAVGDALWP